jgi:hypothetical protein
MELNADPSDGKPPHAVHGVAVVERVDEPGPSVEARQKQELTF